MAPSLKFSVEQILRGNGLRATEKLPPERFQEADLGAVLFGDVNAELEFSLGASHILLTGRLRGSWTLTCARCLREFRTRYASRLDETFPMDVETIDCEDEIRQSLALAAPGKPLCRPDCKGLCSRCGNNLNDGPCGCPPGSDESLGGRLRKS
jgi:uncharacterized metal-binding protein YceD (DUF177 family)